MIHPEFPQYSLRSPVKIIIKPAENIKSHMEVTKVVLSDNKLNACKNELNYHKLLFGLLFFQALIWGRNKYNSLLHCNVLKSDFMDSQFLLATTLNKDEENIQWNLLKYFIGEVCYDGIVTNFWDRRIIIAYLNEILTQHLIDTKHYKLSELSLYYVPENPLSSFKGQIESIPLEDHSEAFGLHSNREVLINIENCKNFCSDLLEVFQLKEPDKPKMDVEDKVRSYAEYVLHYIEAPVNYWVAENALLKCQLLSDQATLQEVRVYTNLTQHILKILRSFLNNTMFTMTSENLNEIIIEIFENKVPHSWSYAYPSRKPLASWTDDLILRIQYFNERSNAAASGTLDKTHWLSAYTRPSRLLMFVLQDIAQREGVHVDQMAWEFIPQPEDEDALQPTDTVADDDGILVRGLFVEQASWDLKKCVLVEPKPLQFISPLSLIHFKPVLKVKKQFRDETVMCPLLYCPVKEGEKSNDLYVTSIELNRGRYTCGHWIKREINVLLSHAD